MQREFTVLIDQLIFLLIVTDLMEIAGGRRLRHRDGRLRRDSRRPIYPLRVRQRAGGQIEGPGRPRARGAAGGVTMAEGSVPAWRAERPRLADAVFCDGLLPCDVAPAV